MARLLDLPSELLFAIIDLVVTSIHWPEESKRYRPVGDTGLFPRNIYCVPKLKLDGRYPALSLLLTSQKLYLETQTYLSKKPQTLNLDVAIVDDHWIWPTWRNLPVRKDGAFDRIDVHFILCCTEHERSLQDEWNTESVAGACHSTDKYCLPATRYLNWRALNPLNNLITDERIAASIANTLSDFMEQPFSGEPIGSPFISRTKTLAFHIDTSAYRDRNRLLSESEVPVRIIDGLAHLYFKQLYPANVERAKHFLKDVQEYVQIWFQEGKEKKEALPRVGKVLFCIDGATVRGLDPAQYALGISGD
ncbi:hypothetical protein COCC4DRAFT_62236 [Bipolaris maydis ATCC 48331]|uniref:F-box domain-containing protein n=2 Tax=Cochliobolus heterostrophus TaxID=5016 RepID=M2UDV4_COCH5|nr:uncharacterized protein COCC4DRAFT_62236 [Bipolaris maydis ATCC 48331]EMD96739.1 hypothetical protein COCHEDRAFT_1025246 [Bipolaris maydis C5]KAJ5060575.1 hypothetical protein J3E74DRAFT_428750 [Bipolaris maydis]ENI03606.1 hypothetical protein COCC4DRAFT_62236 [Bipolaris maydis ATCC 48331]KAJ6201598.1 hypothetical protein J3E72DRAFT_181870 [Bipolaris maydis]KAJ6211381.1 hypothetical protein PSV09DRAFT_1025246 [Bipolaris maydis]